MAAYTWQNGQIITAEKLNNIQNKLDIGKIKTFTGTITDEYDSEQYHGNVIVWSNDITPETVFNTIKEDGFAFIKLLTSEEKIYSFFVQGDDLQDNYIKYVFFVRDFNHHGSDGFSMDINQQFLLHLTETESIVSPT